MFVILDSLWGYKKNWLIYLIIFYIFYKNVSKLFLNIPNVLMTMFKSINPRTQIEAIENGDAHSSGIQFHVLTSTVTHSLQNTIPFLSPSTTQIPLFQLQNVNRDWVIIPSDSLHHPPNSTRWTCPDWLGNFF